MGVLGPLRVLRQVDQSIAQHVEEGGGLRGHTGPHLPLQVANAGLADTPVVDVRPSVVLPHGDQSDRQAAQPRLSQRPRICAAPRSVLIAGPLGACTEGLHDGRTWRAQVPRRRPRAHTTAGEATAPRTLTNRSTA